MPSSPVRVRLIYLACCLLWGSTWLAIKVGLRDLPPLFFAATRMSLAAAVLLPFAAAAGLRRLPRAAVPRIAGIGLLQIGVPYALLFAGQQWVPSGLAAVLFATFPVWLVLLARLLLPNQELTPRKLLAAALGVAGIAVLQLPALRGQALSPLAAVGGALVVAASILIALANVLVRKHLGPYPPLVSVFVQVLSGALLLTALSAGLEHGRGAQLTLLGAGAIVYLAVFGTAITYLCLFWLIPRISISVLGAIPLLDTLFAVALGTLFLHEEVGWPLLAGGALVLTGVAIANFSRQPAASRARPQPFADLAASD